MEVLNFYSFYPLEDPAASGAAWRSAAEGNELTGTLLLAAEGLNVSLCGSHQNLLHVLSTIRETAPVADGALKWHHVEQSPFRRLTVKIKAELIKTSWHANPALNSGAYLQPMEVRALLDDPNTLFVDMRNRYESAIGAFRGALRMPLDEFHELPQKLALLDAYRDKRLVTYCTGGIRCEKSTPLLVESGFSKVYQIEGGILRYLEECGGEGWEGECFVFDDRVSVDAQLRPGGYQFCSACGQPARRGHLICDSCLSPATGPTV
ncbi:MAG: hypothetical protein K1X75_04410 [Leptospirales bacterium]|nr:hypothetical protein [Leptospirales bacterium]